MCTKYVYVGFPGGLSYCLGDRCRLEDICQNAAASYFHFNQKGQTLRRSNALVHIRTCSINCLFAHVQGNVARSKVPTRKASGPGVVEWRMSHGACERLSGFLYNAAAAHASCYIQVKSDREGSQHAAAAEIEPVTTTYPATTVDAAAPRIRLEGAAAGAAEGGGSTRPTVVLARGRTARPEAESLGDESHDRAAAGGGCASVNFNEPVATFGLDAAEIAQSFITLQRIAIPFTPFRHRSRSRCCWCPEWLRSQPQRRRFPRRTRWCTRPRHRPDRRRSRPEW